MASTILHIKNMVCNRCIKVVKEELSSLKFTVASIELGEVHLREDLGDDDLGKIRQMLADNGFELIDDQKSQIINR
ncbi:MAG: heavy-metal-associated domain-containing protein, partial [Cyclobacteriaceae bacterium]|nr:heavy-metal-associated domain-containing protein [Cyclobacteriaceae bacterium]